MKKTQKVIDSCNDCEFRHISRGLNESSSKAHIWHICRHILIIDEEEIEHSEPFLLDVCDNGSNYLPIPENCPLEDYKEQKP